MVSRGFKAPTDGCIYKTFGYKNKFNLIKKWGKFKSGRAIRIRIFKLILKNVKIEFEFALRVGDINECRF